jgi:hypothetical protein
LVTSIGSHAFSDCNGLTEMYVKVVNPPSVGTDAFYNVFQSIPVHVPCSRKTDYQRALIWNNFSNIIDDIPYNITLQSNDTLMGRANVIQANTTCQNNQATIEAIPNAGYRFVLWSDGNTTNPRTITVSQDITLMAEFAVSTQGMYHVSILINNSDMGNVSGSGDFALNTTMSITAMPNQGYQFLHWNNGNTQNQRSITVLSDTSFIAIFAVAPQGTYYVSTLSNNPTMGGVIGNGTYAENTLATLTANANAGYRFVQWTDSSTQNPRSITVTQDTTIIAIFEMSNAIENIETSIINVYPNPATNMVNIILPENIPHAFFTLYDMQGKMIIKQEVNNQEGVSVNNLAAGIYLYKVTTTKEIYQGKIIIKK